RARVRRAARLRGRAAAAHARGRARRPRRIAACRAHAAARREGEGSARGPRPCDSRRRAGARAVRARAPHPARAGGPGDDGRRDRGRRGHDDARAVGAGVRGWRVPGGFTATLCAGAILLAAAVLFDAEALYVPGIALVVLTLGACAWVLTGTLGTTVERLLETRRALEDEPVEVTVLARPGVTILPGTELADPLLNEPLLLRPAAGIHRVRIEVR